MCECYDPCVIRRPYPDLKWKIFNILLLDCWQREYDKRPYRNFVFKRLDFEERLGRSFSVKKERNFSIIVEFLLKRKLNTVSITGINIPQLPIENFIKGLKNIRSLSLKMMLLQENFFDEMAKCVDEMCIKELNLEGSKLSNHQVKGLHAFLVKSTRLKSLNVSSCDINQRNFAIVADGVYKCVSMRRFHCNRILGGGLHVDSHKICHTVSSLIWQNKLEELEMQKCDFIAHDMEIIGEYLWNPCSKMRRLNLGGNIIGSNGVEYLMQAIIHSGTLTDLNVSTCTLGTHGGDVIAKYLSSAFQLQSLNITYNDIGADAINNILTMMKKRIKELNIKLYGNHFDAKSGKILKRLLSSRVVPQESIDITVTYEEDLDYYRIVPYY